MRSTLKNLVLTFLASACSMLCVAFADGNVQLQQFQDRLWHAYESYAPLPLVSQSVPDIDVPAAYKIQHQFVHQILTVHRDKINGYKAGLTSTELQQRFDYSEPIMGVLFLSGKINHANSRLLYDRNRRIEMEIGFSFAHDITLLPSTVDDLRHSVDYVMPVIELPQVNYLLPIDLKLSAHSLQAVDLIATNVGSAEYIQSSAILFSNLRGDINTMRATLVRDGETIQEVIAKNVAEDQWQALQWLVKAVLDQGYVIDKNDMLITGAIGGMTTAERGKYTATFEKLGQIQFEIY